MAGMRIEAPKGKKLISYEDALEVLSRDEAFKATVSAMNTLLLAKGIYSAEEYEFHFRQAAERQLRKRNSANHAPSGA